MSLESAEPKRPTCVVCQEYDIFGVLAVAHLIGTCSHRQRSVWLCQEHLDAAMQNRVLCFDIEPPEEVSWTLDRVA